MWHGSRRDFLKTAGVVGSLPLIGSSALGQRQPALQLTAGGAQVLNPRMRVPLSFIIDDSTCLANMGRFCMPQFATAWPQRAAYKKPWRSWPHEIPDAFVREFGQWCASHRVKGKYSIVPYPACVGWLDRELPGWSRKELLDSLKLVRDLMVPNWDIHPEMITHTRVIDIKTGRPLQEISAATMENSYPRTKKSVDELTAYLAYALRILKNCDLPCEGITTPGGFGNMVKTELSMAVQEAVRDVYNAEIPHYFKYVASGKENAQPRIEHARDIFSDDPRLTVSIYAGTGDWFGGWDGDLDPQGDSYCNQDATAGRMVELIERGGPAIMLCHWPGMFCQGTRRGFAAFQKVVLALEEHQADQTVWMKPSEIARYWAARELTAIERAEKQSIRLRAPFACPQFTLQVSRPSDRPPHAVSSGKPIALKEVSRTTQLRSGTWVRDDTANVVCFDLKRGETVISL